VSCIPERFLRIRAPILDMMMNTATPMPIEKPMMALSPSMALFCDADDCKTGFNGDVERMEDVGIRVTLTKIVVVLLTYEWCRVVIVVAGRSSDM